MREVYLVTLDNYETTPVAAFTNWRKAQRFHRAMGGGARMMVFHANPPIGPWTTYVAMDRQGDVLERWTRVTPMGGYYGTSLHLTNLIDGTPRPWRTDTVALAYQELSRDAAGALERAQALRELVIDIGLWLEAADAKAERELNRQIGAWFKEHTGVVEQSEAD